jgi:hypothetical protein
VSSEVAPKTDLAARAAGVPDLTLRSLKAGCVRLMRALSLHRRYTLVWRDGADVRQPGYLAGRERI